MLGYFDDLIHIGTGLRLVHDAAKPWDRRSPERLGINAQVDDLFHGRSDTGGPRAHASPNMIAMLQSGKRGYTGAPSADASAKRWERRSPERQ